MWLAEEPPTMKFGLLSLSSDRKVPAATFINWYLFVKQKWLLWNGSHRTPLYGLIDTVIRFFTKAKDINLLARTNF